MFAPSSRISANASSSLAWTTDYRGRPFEPMPRLLAIAEENHQAARDLRPLRQSRGPHPAACR